MWRTNAQADRRIPPVFCLHERRLPVQSRASVHWRQSVSANSIVPSAFSYGRGGTPPRLMMSYLWLSASINVSSAICASLKVAEFGEKLVEAGRLKDHQAARRAAGRQIERVRHAWRNMHACARLRRHPIAVNMEIHDTVEDVKCLGVLAMQMQTKRKFALEIVFHQRIGTAGVGCGHLDEGVIAGPVVVRSTARRNEAIALLRHAPSST